MERPRPQSREDENGKYLKKLRMNVICCEFLTLMVQRCYLFSVRNIDGVIGMFAEEGEDDALPEEPHANPRGLPVPAQEEDRPGDSC